MIELVLLSSVLTTGLWATPSFAGISEPFLKIVNPAGQPPTFLAWWQTGSAPYDANYPSQKLCFAQDAAAFATAGAPGSRAHCLETTSFSKPGGVSIQAGDYAISAELTPDKLIMHWMYIRMFKVARKCFAHLNKGVLTKTGDITPVTTGTVDKWPLGIETIKGFCSYDS